MKTLFASMLILHLFSTSSVEEQYAEFEHFDRVEYAKVKHSNKISYIEYNAIDFDGTWQRRRLVVLSVGDRYVQILEDITK